MKCGMLLHHIPRGSGYTLLTKRSWYLGSMTALTWWFWIMYWNVFCNWFFLWQHKLYQVLVYLPIFIDSKTLPELRKNYLPLWFFHWFEKQQNQYSNTQCEVLKSKHVIPHSHGSKLRRGIHIFNFNLNVIKPVELLSDPSCFVLQRSYSDKWN